jgi:hypothetical protein
MRKIVKENITIGITKNKIIKYLVRMSIVIHIYKLFQNGMIKNVELDNARRSNERRVQAQIILTGQL